MPQLRHLRDREIQDLLAGRLQTAARRRIARHLMAGCAECAARLQGAARGAFLPEAGESEDAYDACLDRAETALPRLTATWEEEGKRRDAGVAKVKARSFGSLTSADRRRIRGHWAGVEMLLELSFAARFRDRKLMLQLAESAERAAWRLAPSDRYPAALLTELRARAAAEVANAERVNEYFLRAGETLEKRARTLADRGTGDPALQAHLDYVEGALRKAERSIAEADVLLDRAYRVYRRLGEDHLAGRVLVTKGVSRGLDGQPSLGVEIFREALELLDPVRDPQLVAVAQHNLIDALIDAGELGEASRLLLEGNLRQVFRDDPLNLLRLRWLEGKLLAGRGRHAGAERVLAEVRDGFRAQGLEYVAAVAGVDLARVYLAQNKKGDLHAAASDLTARARAKRLPSNAVSAIRCFEVTCELGLAVESYAVFLQRFLQEAEHHPGLSFEPEMMLSNRS